MYNAGGESAIRFLGQVDKSKIPVGYHVLVSTGVNINHKVIVSVDDNKNTNKAADHVFLKKKKNCFCYNFWRHTYGVWLIFLQW